MKDILQKLLSYLWLHKVAAKRDEALTVLFGLYAQIQKVQQGFPLGNSLLSARDRDTVGEAWKRECCNVCA